MHHANMHVLCMALEDGYCVHGTGMSPSLTCMLHDTCTSHTWNTHVIVNMHGGYMVHAYFEI